MATIIGSLPYTLTNGTTADANAVMADLNFIVSQVNANVTTAIAAAVLAALPVGIIAEWSGSVASIPAPWQLCDGTNGTPDKRDTFQVGAGGAYAVGATGGSITQTITVAGHVLTVPELPAHNHGVNDPAHTHGVNDPTHAHGLNDPTHVHTIQGVSGSQNGVTNNLGGAGTVTRGPTQFSTDAASTGMTMNAAATGITNQNAATGITTQNAGGGAAHAHTATGSDNRPPYYASAFIMKMS